MKRIIIGSSVAVVLVVAAVVIVRAETGGGHGWRGHRWHHPGPGGYLAHELNLSGAQRAQIQALWRAEPPALSAPIHELVAENKEMNALAGSNHPDPAEVQKIAKQEASAMETLLVEKALLQSKIYSTVLNPEQRAKADALQERWDSRLEGFADRLGAPAGPK